MSHFNELKHARSPLSLLRNSLPKTRLSGKSFFSSADVYRKLMEPSKRILISSVRGFRLLLKEYSVHSQPYLRLQLSPRSGEKCDGGVLKGSTK